MARVLVVDDNDEIRGFIRRILEASGHVVIEAGNGREAMKLAKESPVDVVITDVFMPEFDGLEMMRSLRKLQPHLKVIAVSGGGSMGNMDILHAAKLFGAYRVFTKPFASRDLVNAVNEAAADTKPAPSPEKPGNP